MMNNCFTGKGFFSYSKSKCYFQILPGFIPKKGMPVQTVWLKFVFLK